MLDNAKIVVLAAGALLLQDEGVGVHFNDVSTLASSPPEQGEKPHHRQHAKERGYTNSSAAATLRGYNSGRFVWWLHFGYSFIRNFIGH